MNWKRSLANALRATGKLIRIITPIILIGSALVGLVVETLKNPKAVLGVAGMVAILATFNWCMRRLEKFVKRYADTAP
jgi:uncharacterized membrane protein YraQ (UPF0718 family)